MKYLTILPLLGFLACCAQKQVQAPEMASLDQCNALYHHILEVETDRVSTDYRLTSDERQLTIQAMDEEMRRRGTTGKFFAYCTNRMTPAQVQCAIRSSHLDTSEDCKL